MSIYKLYLIYYLEIIDETLSTWGSTIFCEYISIIPFVEMSFAIIWTTLFFMCGHGGRSDGS